MEEFVPAKAVKNEVFHRKRKFSEQQDIIDDDCSWTGFLIEVDKDSTHVISLSSRLLREKQRWLNDEVSFESFPSLQYLDLYKCRYIERLHDSVVQLGHLKSIKLNRCNELRLLPESIGKLCNLEVLDMTDCVNVSHLPDSIGDLTR
jgi:hypothetical protein